MKSCHNFLPLHYSMQKCVVILLCMCVCGYVSVHKHKKSHSEERAHPCPLCDKSFKFPYKLTQHMITHTRDRKHACDDCGTCADRRVRAHASRNDATKKNS